jgi:hypothetical protein
MLYPSPQGGSGSRAGACSNGLSVVIEMLHEVLACCELCCPKSHVDPFLSSFRAGSLLGTNPGFRCAPPWAETSSAFELVILCPIDDYRMAIQREDFVGIAVPGSGFIFSLILASDLPRGLA